MTDILVRKRRPQTVSLYIDSFEDARLSWKATGILLYLLTKPDGWIVRMTDLMRRHTDGEKSVQAGVKELELAGYLYRFKIRINGRIDWRSIVSDVPLKTSEFQELELDYVSRLKEIDPSISTTPPKRRHGTIPPKQGRCNSAVVTGSIRCLKTSNKKNSLKKQLKNEPDKEGNAPATEVLGTSCAPANEPQKEFNHGETSGCEIPAVQADADCRVAEISPPPPPPSPRATVDIPEVGDWMFVEDKWFQVTKRTRYNPTGEIVLWSGDFCSDIKDVAKAQKSRPQPQRQSANEQRHQQDYQDALRAKLEPAGDADWMEWNPESGELEDRGRWP